MKPLSLLIYGCILCGCVENTPLGDDVREHLERGLSGQGRLVPLGKPKDSTPSAAHPQ